MKRLNKYFDWKKLNEELEASTILSAASEHEKEGRPQKAHELRSKVDPDYKQEFKFYFFPLTIKGDVVTFRAYVDNRGDAVKLSRILKVFNDLPGLPEANKLWREIEKTHKSEGLVTVKYEGNPKFMFKASGGYFVSHQPDYYANPREVEVGPIVLYDTYALTKLSKDPNNTYNIYKAFVESEKDAKDINELIKLFLLVRDNQMSVSNFTENNLITEKKEGDIEVKAKFVPLIEDHFRRKKDSFEFFGFEFNIDDDKFKSKDSFRDILGLSKIAYITLIDESHDAFTGSKLFTIVS